MHLYKHLFIPNSTMLVLSLKFVFLCKLNTRDERLGGMQALICHKPNPHALLNPSPYEVDRNLNEGCADPPMTQLILNRRGRLVCISFVYGEGAREEGE
ncbi:hypothetical protein AVEN_222572-1 [Araneus ventricosus]|uniref:Uncharacterized protein n=1 Tax=Araneus ventricosus TaxID=182803 RepID=A0A4Y2N1S9_ARAVE|nr:hypothetical protein AVEN_222572-1 [Araneus ventricosus]